MAVKELYTASERWFTDQAVSRQLITQEQVSKAVADQLMIRHQEGRSVRVWEVMVLNGVMLPEIVEDLLESLVSQMPVARDSTCLVEYSSNWVTLPASSLKNHLPYRPRSGRVVHGA